MSHAQTSHPFASRGSAATPAATFFERVIRAWRFTVDVVRDARAMEAKYRRENRTPFHGW